MQDEEGTVRFFGHFVKHANSRTARHARTYSCCFVFNLLPFPLSAIDIHEPTYNLKLIVPVCQYGDPSVQLKDKEEALHHSHTMAPSPVPTTPTSATATTHKPLVVDVTVRKGSTVGEIKEQISAETRIPTELLGITITDNNSHTHKQGLLDDRVTVGEVHMLQNTPHVVLLAK